MNTSIDDENVTSTSHQLPDPSPDYVAPILLITFQLILLGVGGYVTGRKFQQLLALKSSSLFLQYKIHFGTLVTATVFLLVTVFPVDCVRMVVGMLLADHTAIMDGLCSYKIFIHCIIHTVHHTGYVLIAGERLRHMKSFVGPPPKQFLTGIIMIMSWFVGIMIGIVAVVKSVHSEDRPMIFVICSGTPTTTRLEPTVLDYWFPLSTFLTLSLMIIVYIMLLVTMKKRTTVTIWPRRTTIFHLRPTAHAPSQEPRAMFPESYLRQNKCAGKEELALSPIEERDAKDSDDNNRPDASTSSIAASASLGRQQREMLQKFSCQSDSSKLSALKNTSLRSLSSLNWSSLEEFKLTDEGRISSVGKNPALLLGNNQHSRLKLQSITTCSSFDEHEEDAHIKHPPRRKWKKSKRKKRKITMERSTSTTSLVAKNKERMDSSNSLKEETEAIADDKSSDEKNEGGLSECLATGKPAVSLKKSEAFNLESLNDKNMSVRLPMDSTPLPAISRKKTVAPISGKEEEIADQEDKGTTNCSLELNTNENARPGHDDSDDEEDGINCSTETVQQNEIYYTPVQRKHSFKRYAGIVIKKNSIASNYRRRTSRATTVASTSHVETHLTETDKKLVTNALSDFASEEEIMRRFVISKSETSSLHRDEEVSVSFMEKRDENPAPDIEIHITRPSTDTIGYKTTGPPERRRVFSGLPEIPEQEVQENIDQHVTRTQSEYAPGFIPTRNKNFLKALKKMFLIIASFIVCLLPLSIVHLLLSSIDYNVLVYIQPLFCLLEYVLYIFAPLIYMKKSQAP